MQWIFRGWYDIWTKAVWEALGQRKVFLVEVRVGANKHGYKIIGKHIYDLEISHFPNLNQHDIWKKNVNSKYEFEDVNHKPNFKSANKKHNYNKYERRGTISYYRKNQHKWIRKILTFSRKIIINDY